MMQTDTFQTFETRAEAAACASGTLVTSLVYGLADHGHASFMGSGGTSPAPVYQRMSECRINWHGVTVGLVDERWVSPKDTHSNEKLLRDHLLTDQAARATFLPMRTCAASPKEAAPDVDKLYRSATSTPYDAVLLGMGTDGHTASWFPGADELDAALDPDGRAHVMAINAAGAPVAGNHPQRLTLTLAALGSARMAVLLIYGEEKRAVIETALAAGDDTLPISRAIAALGDRLTILWAP